MNVILLEKIRKLGDIGQEVSVKSGFARNFLFPQKKAIKATPENLEKFEEQRKRLEVKAEELLNVAKARAERLEKLVVSISMRATEEGHLFGSVGVKEIVDAVCGLGEKVDKKELVFSEGAIRQLGEYTVSFQLHSDVTASIGVKVVAE